MKFVESLKLLISDVCARLPELTHINLAKVNIAASSCRSRRRPGTVAYVLPMRFRGGSPVEIVRRRGRTYHFAYFPVMREGHEILYCIHFLLPRFLNLKPVDKIETIVHELYHIHPDFNGDLRRISGRLHGPTASAYQSQVSVMTKRYLALGGERSLALDFVRLNHYRFESVHGPIPTLSRLQGSRPRLLKVEPPLPSDSRTRSPDIDLEPSGL